MSCESFLTLTPHPVTESVTTLNTALSAVLTELVNSQLSLLLTMSLVNRSFHIDCKF